MFAAYIEKLDLHREYTQMCSLVPDRVWVGCSDERTEYEQQAQLMVLNWLENGVTKDPAGLVAQYCQLLGVELHTNYILYCFFGRIQLLHHPPTQVVEFMRGVRCVSEFGQAVLVIHTSLRILLVTPFGILKRICSLTRDARTLQIEKNESGFLIKTDTEWVACSLFGTHIQRGDITAHSLFWKR